MSNRMQRMERRDKMSGVVKIALVAVVTVAALGLVYRIGCQAVTAFQKMRQDIKIVQYGTLEDKLTAQAVVLNQEELFLAKEAGRFENLVKEGEKVSKGTLLGYYMTNEAKSSVRASKAGIFIRATDGLEEVFGKINLAEVTPEVFQYKPTAAFLEKPVPAGQSMYKIVDSLVPTRLLISLPVKKLDFAICPDQKIVVIDENMAAEKGSIVEMKQEGDDLMMLVQLNRFNENTVKKRFVEVEIVFDSEIGFLIPEKAIVEKDGQKGVYCSIGEFTTFKTIEIIKQKGDVVLVEGLDKNDFIVTNPPAKI